MPNSDTLPICIVFADKICKELFKDVLYPQILNKLQALKQPEFNPSIPD